MRRVSLVTLASFVLSAIAPAGAHADPAAETYTSVEPATPPQSSATASGDPGTVQVVPPSSAATPPPADLVHQEPQALPTGEDKSGVTSQAISVPKGSGTIEGMNESFSAQLSTGIATFSVPFSLLRARGGAQPSLALSYSSASGFGNAGVGWDVSVPFIARQTDRGSPKYQDGTDWHPERDRFVFNGGQELVPICVVGSATHGCSGRLQAGENGVLEALPVWATAGWEYYRPRVEGSFLRFFWSPSRGTWRVQSKSGVTMELGVPLDEPSYTQALERNPDEPGEIYRWHLVRMYDTYGNANPASGPPVPVNVVVYRYLQDAGRAYLTDIFDTTPASNPTTTNFAEYAHRTSLVWEPRSDPSFSYRSGWRIDQRLRLASVELASKTFAGGTNESFRRVRRYTLSYDDSFHVSLLDSVQVEGRCAGDEQNAIAAGSSQTCATLPPMKFGYSHVKPAPGSLGYEDFDEQVRTFGSSPKHSIDETLTDLFDVDANALPDVVVTAPALFGGKHGLFLNGVAPSGGNGNPLGLGFTSSTIAVSPLGVPPGTDENVLKFTNSNVTPFDLDGDGRADLVHMPLVKKYEIFSPEKSGGGWLWKGRSIATADQQDVKIDFTNESPKIRVVDVDFDGLVDVVVTTGTQIQTFFALGRYPHADGQFGQAVRTGPESATVSNDPVTTCLPWSASAVQFSDEDIRLADMNGDGITDIVRVRSGDIRYWPGRGNGFWGTGRRDDCPAGTYGQDRHIAMSTSPNYQVIQGNGLSLDDVNGDGLADLVEVRFNAVDVYLNVDGVGWTDRHILFNTPPAPSVVNRVRLVDVDGSGTRDILWGDGYDYKYIDLQGGVRPWLLTKVENGLGKTTSIEYSTSTAEMIAATKAGQPWSDVAPSVAHVVKSVTESDGLGGTYVTEYSYRDAVYDGQQREFRGFRSARVARIGDANSPTDQTTTEFLLGECLDEEPADGIDACSISERWRDNPREALKGLPLITERFDEGGRYLSTERAEYTLRGLYLGLDGRAVRHAFESKRETFLYDTEAAGGAGPDVQRDAVTRELLYPTLPPSLGVADTQVTVPVRHAAGHAVVAGESRVDVFGNRTRAIARGCTGGGACPQPDETIEMVTEPTRPAGDPTGWLWRTDHTFVTGSLHPGNRNETFTEFNAQGDPTETSASLTGTVGIDRFRAGGGSVGSAPSDASQDGTLLLSVRTYTAFGNLESEVAPTGLAGNERCRSVGYDPLYGQLPTSETLFTAGCGSGALTTGAAYDRGLSLVTIAVDMNGQPSAFAYDELGRLSSITRPDPAGGPGTTPAMLFAYFLPDDLGKPYSAIHTRTQDGESPAESTYLESISFVDGLGRARATLSEADPTLFGGDDGDFVVSGFVDYDAKGSVRRKYLEHYTSVPWQSFDLSVSPNAPYARRRNDAFGRQFQSFDLDGTVTLQSRYHALSADLFDAADLQPGPHQGTPASVRTDGHGRTVTTTERYHEGAGITQRETRALYLPTGEPELIERGASSTSDTVVRWMRYDSLGRMILNVEPNTTSGFTPDLNADPTPSTQGGTIRAWRYAYNDQGELVATSDARGCGVSFAYDGAGRLLGEDYSPCEPGHETYTATNRATLAGFEILYRYDTVPSPPAAGREPPPSFFKGTPPVATAGFSAGRLVAVWDRAAASWTEYDARGRIVQQATRVARPNPSPGFSNRYAARWYQRSFAYDAADRTTRATTGATVSELQGTGAESAVTTAYTRRGSLGSAAGSYGELIHRVQRGADGLLESVVYGDVAQTTTGFTYDNRRRLKSVQTYRGPPPIWSQPGAYDPAPNPDPNNLPTFQLLLQDEDFDYDSVNNPVEVRDWRIAGEWPAGAKPVTRKIQYDDLYRVTRVDHQYAAGDDAWTSPHAADLGAPPSDPRRAPPSPHVSFANRVLSQTFAYDWLGNTAATEDDARGFYDRSLGTVQNSATKPYQLASASNKSGAPSTRNGELAAAYDAAGNLTRLKVERNGPCLPTGAQCSQIFAYDWDEVGRLVRGRRWDVPAAALGAIGDVLPNAPAQVTLEHAYDAGDQRVIKRALGPGGNPLANSRHTLYIFDSLELRRAPWMVMPGGGGPPTFDYELSEWTEVPYLFANGVRLARVVFDEADPPSEPELPSVGGAKLHVLFELGDHLGSTSVVLDQATSELVERSTFYAYGATESDHRPERWKGFREDYRFTGKEEDVEVGLQYFGKRFYAPALQRWVSADPLEIHEGGSGDFNLYAYVSGASLRATDPLGMQQTEFGQRLAALGENSPPPPRGYSFHGDVTVQYRGGGNHESSDIVIKGDRARAPPAPPESPISLSAPGVPDVPSAVGGAKGFYNTAVVGSVEAALWNTPGVNAYMLLTGWRPLEGVKAEIGEGQEGGAFVGTGVGIVTQIATGRGVQTVVNAPRKLASGVLRGEAGASSVAGIVSTTEGGGRKIALDANILIRAIERGEGAAVDAAIAGRTPVVPVSAAKEFLRGIPPGETRSSAADALRNFLASRGGRIAAPGSEALRRWLQINAALARPGPRVLQRNDARISAGAIKESAPLLTGDVRLRRTLNALGVAVEQF